MDLETRIAAVRGRMAEEGIDLLVAASNGLHTLDRADAVVYLVDYRSVGESILLLDRDSVELIVSPAADSERVAARALPGEPAPPGVNFSIVPLLKFATKRWPAPSKAS